VPHLGWLGRKLLIHSCIVSSTNKDGLAPQKVELSPAVI